MKWLSTDPQDGFKMRKILNLNCIRQVSSADAVPESHIALAVFKRTLVSVQQLEVDDRF
jgi:hypothetical protein